MAESDDHREEMFYFIDGLMAHYESELDKYVGGNNFIYWEKGNPRKAISPDVYVIFGVPMRLRDCYKAWEEGGRLPDIVFEFTSNSTKKEDEDIKGPLYKNELKVREYIRFDPTGDYLKPQLQGIRRVGDSYKPIPLVDGRLYSEVLNLWLEQDGNWLWMVDPETMKRIPTSRQNLARARAEAARANSEAARADFEAARAEAERQSREEAERRAESERQARLALEAEIDRLRSALRGRSEL